MSKRALGKGIDALLGGGMPGIEDEDEGAIGGEMELGINQLVPNPEQPRKEFKPEALQELADSIREQGIIQPIVVERMGDKYQIVAGERRFRAAKIAGKLQVPVVVRAFTPEQKLEIALIENIQREDLNPIEEANAYKQLMESTGMSQEELAKRVGKNRSTIANAMRLLKMGRDMQDALVKGDLTPGHARAILSVINPADQMILFSRIVNDGLSVREAENMSLDLNKGLRGEASPRKEDRLPKKLDPDLQGIEQRLIEVLGTKVAVKGSMKKGSIEIQYYSMDDLGRLYDLIVKD